MNLQKSPRFESKKLLDAARGLHCQNCGADDGTTVAAHANWHEYGKGRGLKCHDFFTAHLCFECHTWLDSGSAVDPTGVYASTDKREMWESAHRKTLVCLFDRGFLKVA